MQTAYRFGKQVSDGDDLQFVADQIVRQAKRRDGIGDAASAWTTGAVTVDTGWPPIAR